MHRAHRLLAGSLLAVTIVSGGSADSDDPPAGAPLAHDGPGISPPHHKHVFLRYWTTEAGSFSFDTLGG